MEEFTSDALQQTSLYSPVTRPWVQILLIAVGFTTYELIKEFTNPNLTRWQSHAMSIIVVTLIGMFVICRYARIVKKQLHALQCNNAKIEAGQVELEAVNQGIERLVQERTSELQSEIRERKQVELRLTMQYEASRLLASSKTLVEAAPEVLRTLCDHIDWDYAGLWLVDAGANVMRCLDTFHRPGVHLEDFAQRSRQITFAKGVGAPGRVWMSGEATWISDVLDDSNFPRAPLADKCGLRTAFAFPILSGGEVIGAIEFLSQKLRPRDEDLLTMRNIGGQVGLLVERDRADAAKRDMHKELIAASRKEGMAEVANGVLHNVGNVLNSVNVSVSVVSDLLRKSRVSKLGVAVQVLTEHASDLTGYLSREERGSNLTSFLAQLANHLNGETRAMTEEIQALAKNLDHMKEIVSTQQAYAGSPGLVQSVDVRQLLEDALRIDAAALAGLDVVVVRKFADVPPIQADKHKLMQILVNLIGNARHAMAASPTRTLTLQVAAPEGGGTRVSVCDTGYGIAPENMRRIFAHGFTTKKDGHGFGLHSSALAAKDMKGSLSVHSDGTGHGAVFILELPPVGREAVAS